VPRARRSLSASVVERLVLPPGQQAAEAAKVSAAIRTRSASGTRLAEETRSIE
jgi:hypothetical protein